MPLIIADDFDEIVREYAIPASSVSVLMQAGTWSARHSRSGFAPGTVVASFTDDPDGAMGPLVAAGFAKRGKKGGIQIINGRGLTVVNANEAEAKQARIRESGKERAQRFRDRRKAAQAEAIRGTLPVTGVTAGVTRETVSVTPTKRSAGPKPQVSGLTVTRDDGVTSHVTDDKNASDNQDQDLNQSSSGVGQIDAWARETPDPAIVTLVTNLIAKKTERVISGVEACRAITVWRKRAEEAGKVVHEPAKFYTTCVKRERDIEMILLPPPNPLWIELGTTPEPVSDGHLYEPESPFADSCSRPGCGLPRKNACHVNQEAKTG